MSPLFKKNPGCDSECYKTFKSFKIPTVPSRKDETKKLTRSNFSSTSEYLSKQNFLPALRIFCESKVKKYKPTWMELSNCLTYAAKTDTRQTAKYNDDQELLTKIVNCNFRYGPDFTAMEVQYHHQPSE